MANDSKVLNYLSLLVFLEQALVLQMVMNNCPTQGSYRFICYIYTSITHKNICIEYTFVNVPLTTKPFKSGKKQRGYFAISQSSRRTIMSYCAAKVCYRMSCEESKKICRCSPQVLLTASLLTQSKELLRHRHFCHFVRHLPNLKHIASCLT